MATTIQIDKSLKQRLDNLKVHQRETYNGLIERLLSNCSPKEIDKESLIATIEILSDPETMKNIAEALNEDKGVSLESAKKQLGI